MSGDKRVVYVEWADSTATHGWITAEELPRIGGCARCCTVGFFVRENEQELLLALNSSADGTASPFGDCIAIPKAVIKRRLEAKVPEAKSFDDVCAARAEDLARQLRVINLQAEFWHLWRDYQQTDGGGI